MPEASTVPVQSDLEEFQQYLAFKAMKQGAANSGGPTLPPPELARRVRDLWNEWIQTLDKPLPEYIASHAHWFLDFEFPFEGQSISIGSQPWVNLIPRMGQAWWTELRRQVKDSDRVTAVSQRGDLLSPAYCNRIRTSASGMFTYHVKLAVKAGSRMLASRRQDDVTENPIHAWPRAQNDELGERLGAYNDDEHLAEFLAGAHPVLRKMSILSSHCGGMRKTENRLLRFSWINWDRSTITLPRVEPTPGQAREARNKNGDARTFPVDAVSMAILQAQRDAHESYSEYVWPNGRGNAPWSDGIIHDWQIEAAAKWGQLLAGEAPCFHHLRHTFATWEIIKGTPINVVMQWGGWKSWEVARKYMKASELLMQQLSARRNLSVREALLGRQLETAGDRKSARRARFEVTQPERGQGRK